VCVFDSHSTSHLICGVRETGAFLLHLGPASDLQTPGGVFEGGGGGCVVRGVVCNGLCVVVSVWRVVCSV
jgi:hypothetical protein